MKSGYASNGLYRSNGFASSPVEEVRSGTGSDNKFKSVRRVFRIMELVEQRGENLTAKQLASEMGVSLSSCYYLINLLAEEGYIEKVPRSGGYRLGPTISRLHESYFQSNFDSKVEPVIEELAQRSGRHVYAAVLSDGEVTVTQVKAPPKSPPVGVVEGFHGASHSLALGKVLLAGMGAKYVDEYIESCGLEAFTPRTIVQPAVLHAQLNKVRMVGVAMDFEEFAANLCCVAAPVEYKSGKVAGAIGISSTARRMRDEEKHMIDLVQQAAGDASALLDPSRKR